MNDGTCAEPRAKPLSRCLLVVAVLIAMIQTAGPNMMSPLSIDEQISYYLALGQTPANVLARCVSQSATPPLYFWLARASSDFGRVLTDGVGREWWLRLPAWLAFLFSLVVVYRIAEQNIAAGAGGPAALLLACHGPVVEQAAMQARPNALGLLGALVVFGSLLQLHVRGWSVLRFVLFVGSNIVLLWTHYLLAVLLPVEVAVAVIVSRRSLAHDSDSLNAIASVTAWQIACIAAIAPLTLYPLRDGLLYVWTFRPYLNWYTTMPSVSRPLDILEHVPSVSSWHWVWLLPLGATAAFVVHKGRVSEMKSALPRFGTALMIWLLAPAYMLWVAGMLGGPSLAQSRYLLPQAGAAALLLVFILYRLYGVRWCAIVVVALVAAGNTPSRVMRHISEPVRHDRFWLDAAVLLDQHADKRDLVLVQSGLVENRLTPIRFADPGFHEYATSRLSNFYLWQPLHRLALPIPWQEGDWQVRYASHIEVTIRDGGRIWLVLSSDSDVGQSTEAGVLSWTARFGLQRELLHEPSVARVWKLERARSAVAPAP